MLKDWKRDPRHYLIPAEICKVVLIEKQFTMFQVYMALKSTCSGQLRINSEVISKISRILDCHTKTVKRHIVNLRDRKWIGYNPNSQIYFVQGFESLRRLEGVSGRRAYWLDIRKIRELKGFTIAVVLTELIHSQQKKIRERQIRGQRRLRPNKRYLLSLPSFYPMATNALSRILGISTRTAAQYRRIAADTRFIELKEDIRPMGDQMKKVDSKQIHLVCEYTSSRNYFIKDGHVWIRKPSLIKSDLSGKKRPKLFRTKSKRLYKVD